MRSLKHRLHEDTEESILEVIGSIEKAIELIEEEDLTSTKIHDGMLLTGDELEFDRFQGRLLWLLNDFERLLIQAVKLENEKMEY